MRDGFEPVDWTKLSQQEKSRVIESLIFMVEKRDGTIKSRLCANGSKQRNWISKQDTSSPTASIKSILLTAVINAKEIRDTIVMDIPNAFIQTEQTGETVHMKIWGKLAEILADMFPDVYISYIVIEKGQMPL